MGRQLALASQALGRSPYDDVVCGDGEGDDRAPLQMYDERGRPVNPETKRINKDVIRSHNEVMLVIGVAETDNGGISDSQVETGLKHIRYEERIGSTLLSVGRMLEQGNVWGVIGLRQRVLVCRFAVYCHVLSRVLTSCPDLQRILSNTVLSAVSV